jgi:hypothetical protein
MTTTSFHQPDLEERSRGYWRNSAYSARTLQPGTPLTAVALLALVGPVPNVDTGGEFDHVVDH